MDVECNKYFYLCRLGLVSPLAFSPQHSAAILSLYGASDFQRSAACWYPWTSLPQPVSLTTHQNNNNDLSRSPPPAHQGTHRPLGKFIYLPCQIYLPSLNPLMRMFLFKRNKMYTHIHS